MSDTKYLTGIVTAWTNDEAKRHNMRGGAWLALDGVRDGYVVRIRPTAVAEVFIDAALVAAEDEQQIRARMKEACEALIAKIRETYK